MAQQHHHETHTDEAAVCCICLSDIEHARALVCPRGHVTCQDDVDGLVGFMGAPEQLRRHRGAIPCPWAGDEGQCEHRWDYREVHEFLGEGSRVRYMESVVGLMSMLLEGGGGRGGAGARTQQDVPASNADGADMEVEEVVAEVMSTILNLRCPSCRAVFFDFEACCAVTCAACGVCFCALCLDESGAGDAADTHVHLVARHGDLFFPQAEVLAQQNAHRSDNLMTYLKALGRDQRTLVYQVLDHLRPACSDIGLELEPIYDELRTFYQGPRGISDEEGAPAVVVASAAALVRRRSTEELLVDDILGTVGRFDPGDYVRVLDTMGVELGRGRAYATCTGSRIIPADDDEDRIIILKECVHLGPERSSSGARGGQQQHHHQGQPLLYLRRHRNLPRTLPPLPSPTDLAATYPVSSGDDSNIASQPTALGKRRRPPSLSLDLLAPRVPRTRQPRSPAFGDEQDNQHHETSIDKGASLPVPPAVQRGGAALAMRRGLLTESAFSFSPVTDHRSSEADEEEVQEEEQQLRQKEKEEGAVYHHHHRQQQEEVGGSSRYRHHDRHRYHRHGLLESLGSLGGQQQRLDMESSSSYSSATTAATSGGSSPSGGVMESSSGSSLSLSSAGRLRESSRGGNVMTSTTVSTASLSWSAEMSERKMFFP